MHNVFGLALAAAFIMPVPTTAQIAVSVHDGKQLKPMDEPGHPRTVDELAVLRLGTDKPVVLGRLAAPVSMIGPPHSIALTPDARLAVATASQKVDAAGPDGLAQADDVTVIDIADPARPRIVQSLHAGAGATGIAINRQGTLALVANAWADSLSVFTIRSGRLSPAGTVTLPKGSKPVTPAFTPDGRNVLLVTQLNHKVERFRVAGTRLTPAGPAFEPGQQPYGMAISPDGRFAFVGTLGGRNGQPPRAPGGPARGSSLAVLEIASGKVVQEVDTPSTVEGITLSRDGRYLEATTLNGSGATNLPLAERPLGIVQVWRVTGGRLTKAAEAPSGRQCQGGAWSGDGRHFYLGCSVEKEIHSYRFDGSRLERVPEGTIRLDARPGAMAVSSR